jgi:hypothetical protein
MNVRRHISRASAAACLSLGLCAAATAARAGNVVLYPMADFASAPYTISFGGGAATYTFTYINDGETADAVSTGGNGLVDSFLGAPSPFNLDTSIGDSPYDKFIAFRSPAGILYSISEDSIGLKFHLADGVHYGYVTLLGPEVLQYGYNSTPGAPIATGAGAPEPATWVMLILGLGALGAATRGGGCRASRNALA